MVITIQEKKQKCFWRIYMDNDIIGRIFGENIDESFTFASNRLSDESYVKILKDGNPDSCLIGKVSKRMVHNPYCLSPEVIRYVNDSFDFHKDSMFIYHVDILGSLRNGHFSLERVPALPGSPVYLASNEDIMAIYGIQGGTIDVGYLTEARNCSVSVDIGRLLNPHLFVVGKTGSGKSYFVKKLLEESTDCFWVFSPTDEYDYLPNKTNCKCLSEIPVPWNTNSMSFYLDLNASEENILNKANELIVKQFEKDNDTTIKSSDIEKSIKEYFLSINNQKPQQIAFDDVFSPSAINDELPRFANTLLNKLKTIGTLSFYNKSDISEFIDMSIVFDLGKYNQLEQEWIISSLLFRLRNHLMHKGYNKKHIIIVEEAHNYLPSEKYTKCKNELVKVSREGRKYGASLCFVTQRPRFFDQTALAQSGNRVVFSLSNPDDIKHVMDEASYYDKELLVKIPRQHQGECTFIGDAFSGIVSVKIS